MCERNNIYIYFLHTLNTKYILQKHLIKNTNLILFYIKITYENFLSIFSVNVLFNNIMAQYAVIALFFIEETKAATSQLRNKRTVKNQKGRQERERYRGKKDSGGNKADEKPGYRNRCLHSCCPTSPPSSQPLQ